LQGLAGSARNRNADAFHAGTQGLADPWRADQCRLEDRANTMTKRDPRKTTPETTVQAVGDEGTGVSQGRLSRRAALGLAGAGAVAGLARPAIAQTTIEWKMATSWPADLPGAGVSAQRICDLIATMSGGRMRVRLFPAGSLVPASEVFDAVASGTAQMGHSSPAYWAGRMPAASFFSTVPFGLLPGEHATWIEFGGGQDLWTRLYAQYGVRPFLAGNTGCQLGGWYRRELTSLEDLKGLRIRMTGLGGEVMRRLGATPVSLPPAELVPALESGLIDAAEFLGPESDRAMGLQAAARFCYTPGFHEPNGAMEALVNTVAFDGLSDDLKAVVQAACRAEALTSLSEADWINSEALRLLVEDDNVQLVTYPEPIMAALRSTSTDVVASLSEGGDLNREIYKSYVRALARVAPWSSASRGSFLTGRGL
jgi:TRAP-type mannitol/chloroaromatic compound transport system substrate-binding protein